MTEETKCPKGGQYCSTNQDDKMAQYKTGYDSEMLVNMGLRNPVKSMGDAARMDHKTVVGTKVITETSLSERKNDAISGVNVMKAFGTMPKTNQNRQPNNVGAPVSAHLYKAGKRGHVKGGIDYR